MNFMRYCLVEWWSTKCQDFSHPLQVQFRELPIPTAGEGKGFLEFVRRIVRHLFPQNSKARAWAISVYFKLKGVR